IILEYVSGKDLREIVKDAGPLDLVEALSVGSVVADVLEHAYQKSIVHRDIKPENIMKTDEGAVKVMDFGLAKSFENAGLSGITVSGTAMGTPAFMAPEQIMDARSADHRSDIYSLGGTLFYILTGALPFAGKSTGQLLRDVMKKPAPRLEAFRADVPDALCAAVARCMEKEPEKRYGSGGEVKEELDKVMIG
ncbi:MAG: serine/threonine protein kinase, partial [Planctomycetota bacterium]